MTYENERISIKNSLHNLKCVLRLSCVVHGPIYGRFMGFYVNGFLSSVVGGKGRYLRRTRANGPNSQAGAYNRPFYLYGGHIEFIRFKEHYGMPRGRSLSIDARLSGKKRTSMYISREKGNRYYIQRRHNDLFFSLQSFSRKT